VPFELCFEFLLSILGPKEVCNFLCYEKKKTILSSLKTLKAWKLLQVHVANVHTDMYAYICTGSHMTTNIS